MSNLKGLDASKATNNYQEDIMLAIGAGYLSKRFFKLYDLLMRGCFVIHDDRKNFHCQFAAFSFYFNRQAYGFHDHFSQATMNLIDRAWGIANNRHNEHVRVEAPAPLYNRYKHTEAEKGEMLPFELN